MRIPMPHFLGIGAMKAGTSWLAAHLRAHPDIWLRRKELHFFDRAFGRRRYPFLPDELEARLRYGGKFLVGALRGKRTGERTPAYAVLSRDRIAVVHSWMPTVRLPYIMRDPVERAWAQARHDFPRFFRKSVRDATESELVAFFDSPNVMQRGDYVTCVANWRSLYHRDQFFFTFLEDVVTDPIGVLRATFRFLEVDSQVELDREAVAAPVYAGEQVPIPEWVGEYLRNTLLADVHTLETLIDRRVPWADRA